MAQSLPLEILQHIFSYLPNQLTPCASVCRQWQVAAEKFTFTDLHINSADLEDFQQIVPSHSARRCFHVRYLYFKVILPEYSVAARGHYENQDDRDSNNKVFTQAITSLFEILSSWPNYDHRQMSLQIYARSPSDWRAEPDWTIRRIRQQRGDAFPEEELLDRRYRDSYLQLRGNVSLPDVYCITSFQMFGSDNFRNVAPGAVSQMVAHLPRLQTVHTTLCTKERIKAIMRDSLEGDLSSTSWPRSLKHLQLDHRPNPIYGDGCSLLSEPGPNSLFLALHQLSQQLESIDLSQIMIGPELFWPVDANNNTPFWPNLIKVTTCFANSLSYDHSSNLQDDSVNPPDDQQHSPFRGLLRKHMDEVYLAAGRAAQYMPRLNHMDLDFVIFLSLGSEYFFRYDASSGTARWRGSFEYSVSNEVQEAWDVAAKGHGHAQICIEVFPSGAGLSL